MSGGAYNSIQYNVRDAISEMEKEIDENKISEDGENYFDRFDSSTVDKLRLLISILKISDNIAKLINDFLEFDIEDEFEDNVDLHLVRLSGVLKYIEELK